MRTIIMVVTFLILMGFYPAESQIHVFDLYESGDTMTVLFVPASSTDVCNLSVMPLEGAEIYSGALDPFGVGDTHLKSVLVKFVGTVVVIVRNTTTGEVNARTVKFISRGTLWHRDWIKKLYDAVLFKRFL